MVKNERPPAPDPLPVPVADSHCHLDIASTVPGGLTPEDALAQAAAVGVTRIVQVGCDVDSSAWAVDAAERYPSVVATVAIHPNEAPILAKAGALDDALAEIDRLAGVSAKVRGVGETGLDHFRTDEEGWASQEESFRAHIEIARRHDAALVIHDRDAHDDVLRVLDDSALPDRVVFHCFSGDVEMARQCVRQGWFLSFAGTVTFKNAASLRSALALTPLENVLVETDAPFLTPHPYRGRTNASYVIPHTVRTIADVTGHDVADVCQAISRNTDQAFKPW